MKIEKRPIYRRTNSVMRTDLYQRIRVLAIQNRQTLTKTLEDVLTRGLKDAEKENKAAG
ncbi:MAG: hypothetical protein ACYCOU_25845 [Sulfobacillus sp.]